MPRLTRLQYPVAIYHIVTRGDGRRKVFHDDGHYERFTRGLAEEVDRGGWIVIAYYWMPNHIHALIKTPQPNLCRGMLRWPSGYANWYAKRNRRTGQIRPPRIVGSSKRVWRIRRPPNSNDCGTGSTAGRTFSSGCWRWLPAKTRERTTVAGGDCIRSRSIRSWRPPRSSTEHRQTRIVAIGVGRAVVTWRRCCAVAGRRRRFESCRVDSD